MKRIVTIALMLAGTCLFAQKNLIGRVEVSLKLINPPEIEYRRVGEISPKVQSVNRWLMVKSEFTVKREQAVPKYRGGNMVFAGFADNVIMSVRVLFDTGFKIGDRGVYCLYTGSTEFYALQCDGKKHLAVMFIPAKLLDRYSRNKDGSVRRAGEKEFKAEVVFSRAGKVLDRAYCNISGGSRAFEEECRSVPENLRVVGGVFPRSRTPWALFDADNFDLEKDFFRSRD